MKITIIGKVDDDGKLILPQRNAFVKDLAVFKGKDVVITVEKKGKKRSTEQNRYYWGIVIPLVKQGLIDVGYRMTTELTHDFLRDKFCIVEIVNEITGEVITTKGKTSEMSTSQMMDYFAQISQWAAEWLNIQIPEPEEQLKIF